MHQYLMLFGTVILINISLINLNSFKFKLKEIMLMLICEEIISSILIIIGGEFLAIIVMMIVPIIFIYKKSKNVLRSISISVAAVLICILGDYLLTNICLTTLGLDVDTARTNIWTYLLFTGIDSMLIFIISKLLGTLINKKTKISNMEFKGKFGLLIFISLMLTLVIFYTNIIYESKNGSGNEIIRINGILFFAYFILLMIIMYILAKSITSEFESKNKQIQFESLHEYTTNLEKLYTDMRAFRHDYINILSSMIGYMQNKDMDGLEKHFNENIFPLSKCMESNNFKIGLLKNIKIAEIKGIFSSKLIRAQELGIDVFIDIMEPIERINIDIIDLSRSMGILLDNAIEGAGECDKPSIKVAVINKEKSVLIIIINSYNKEVPIYKIYQKGFSTKGINRGLGLNNLKEIIGKYTNVSLDTSIENGEFKQFLEVANI